MSTLLHSRIQRVQESFFKPVCALLSRMCSYRPATADRPRPRSQVDRLVVNVPATTANLGPGFDSFGFALDVWNRITVERADEFSMTITGEGADRLDCSEDNMVARMAAKAMKSLGVEPMPLRFECFNAVRAPFPAQRPV